MDMTKRLAEAGRLMGMEVLDHVIVSDGRYFSFREEKLLPEYFQMDGIAAEQSVSYKKNGKERTR